MFAPQDAFLLPLSIVWTGFFVAVALSTRHGGSAVPNFSTFPFLVVGAYLVIGRFIVKLWRFHRTRYALTDQRAVEIIGRRVKREASLADPMTVTRRRGGHAIAVWKLPSSHERPGGVRALLGAGTMPTDMLRGTGWPGADWFARPELAFVNIADPDRLESAALQGGFNLTTKATTTALSPPDAVSQTGRRTLGAKVTGWIRSRLLRRQYALWTPLPPADAIERLRMHLAPTRMMSWVGGSIYTGKVSGWQVRLVCRSGLNNSWRWNFRGAVAVNGPGSWLVGTTGPLEVVAVFSAIWGGLASLFFVGGTIGLVSQLVSGHSPTALPAVLVPGAMIAFFVGMIEFAYRSAAHEWDMMDTWLRQLLQAPGPS
ncbi:MAG: hypothetical protein M0Z62_08165 [Actinomycetota bacterium]|nr:hypothetical protein [Actinomycetota bacterium]